jgi:hypothetical protein
MSYRDTAYRYAPQGREYTRHQEHGAFPRWGANVYPDVYADSIRSLNHDQAVYRAYSKRREENMEGAMKQIREANHDMFGPINRKRSASPRRSTMLRSRSPMRRSASPGRRSRSPMRRSASPGRRSGSPRRRSGSPRRSSLLRSRSPKRSRSRSTGWFGR